MKKVLFTILCLLILFDIKIVNASECDSEDIDRLKALAEGVSINYNYIGDIEENYNYQLYEVSFNGLTDELYIGYFPENSNDRKYIYNNDEKINVNSGTRIFSVYSSKCNIKLKDLSIELIKFNIYSKYPECKLNGISDLNICSSWYQGELNYDIFKDTIKDYEDSLQVEDKFIEKVKKFFISNYIYFIILGIVLLIIIIFCIFKRIQNNKLY